LQVAGRRRSSLGSIQIALKFCFCGCTVALLFLLGCLEIIKLFFQIGSLVLSGLQLGLGIA
jgi:hypothetical protein